jgi:hypothetical protein
MMSCFTVLFLRLAQWKCNLKVAQTKVSPDSSPKVSPDGQWGGGDGAMSEHWAGGRKNSLNPCKTRLY